MELNLFEQAKQIPAVWVMQEAGIPLKQQGDLYRAPCVFHEDKAASMAFYPHGRYYCFSCHKSGDSTALYAALHGVTMWEAASQLLGSAVGRAEEWRTRRRSALCALLSDAQAEIDAHGIDTAWDTRAYVASLHKKELLQAEIDNVLAATREELPGMMREAARMQ